METTLEQILEQLQQIEQVMGETTALLRSSTQSLIAAATRMRAVRDNLAAAVAALNNAAGHLGANLVAQEQVPTHVIILSPIRGASVRLN